MILNPPNETVELEIQTDSYGKIPTQLYCDRNGRINLTSLKDGNYTVTAFCRGTKPPLPLTTFRLRMNNHVPQVSHVDLQATTLHVTFKRSDQPVQGAHVSGRFYLANGNDFSLNGRTDNDGVVIFVLPEGGLEHLVAEKGEIDVKKIGKITLPSPAPTALDVPRPPKYIIIDADSSSFSSSINPMNKNARVTILGDMSGSMCSENKMEILRRSFKEIFVKCQKNGWRVAMASWDDEIEWCIENQWIQSSDINAVDTWISSRQARGGNDMKTAIEDSMKRFPDATDVYVMCDGDITPFSLLPDQSSWATFRAQYPQSTFHFIALGQGASYEPMEAMATIGGGTFTHNT